MEDNASFIPDNIEDFFIINEAGDDVPEEDEFVIVDSIEDEHDEEVDLRRSICRISKSSMSMWHRSTITVASHHLVRSAGIASYGSKHYQASENTFKHSQEEAKKSCSKATSSKSENQQAYKMRNMWCPDHPHEETCSAAPRGKRKMVVSLPDQGLLDLS